MADYVRSLFPLTLKPCTTQAGTDLTAIVSLTLGVPIWSTLAQGLSSKLCKGATPADVQTASRVPHKEWHGIGIFTACHVVFNSEEARSTKVDIFYDDQLSVSDGRMKTVWGVDIADVNKEADYCLVLCARFKSRPAAKRFHAEKEPRIQLSDSGDAF